ncbi:serpin-ZX [Tanacetum coccineum]
MLQVATKILLDDACNGFTNGNFVCSPFSLEIVLGMLAFGATGQTLEQLLEFLGHEALDQLRSESPTSKLFAQILANPNGGEGIPDIILANGVWVAKKLSPLCLLSSYKEVLNTVYNTKARSVDFKNKIAMLDHVVITLAFASGDKGRGFDPHSLQGRRSFYL